MNEIPSTYTVSLCVETTGYRTGSVSDRMLAFNHPDRHTFFALPNRVSRGSGRYRSRFRNVPTFEPAKVQTDPLPLIESNMSLPNLGHSYS
jgi:hypothetical protein